MEELSGHLITAGLYFTQFNFTDELQQVLIAFGFIFHKAESFPTDREGKLAQSVHLSYITQTVLLVCIKMQILFRVLQQVTAE